MRQWSNGAMEQWRTSLAAVNTRSYSPLSQFVLEHLLVAEGIELQVPRG